MNRGPRSPEVAPSSAKCFAVVGLLRRAQRQEEPVLGGGVLAALDVLLTHPLLGGGAVEAELDVKAERGRSSLTSSSPCSTWCQSWPAMASRRWRRRPAPRRRARRWRARRARRAPRSPAPRRARRGGGGPRRGGGRLLGAALASGLAVAVGLALTSSSRWRPAPRRSARRRRGRACGRRWRARRSSRPSRRSAMASGLAVAVGLDVLHVLDAHPLLAVLADRRRGPGRARRGWARHRARRHPSRAVDAVAPRRRPGLRARRRAGGGGAGHRSPAPRRARRAQRGPLRSPRARPGSAPRLAGRRARPRNR